jgi:hypothetical protein
MIMIEVRARRSGMRVIGVPLTCLLVAGLLLLTAACGSGGSSSSSNAADPAGHPSSQSSSQSSGQSGAVAFAQCMRSHGVSDFPDPQNGHFLIPGDVQSNPDFNSAVSACQSLLGPGGATNGGGSNSSTSSLLAFAKCMQTHGVPQFPDPTAGGGIGLPAGVDPNSASFQKAWHECESKLPGSFGGQQP